MAGTIQIDVPGIGPVVLVDREQLRFKLHGRQFSAPLHLKSFAAPAPPPPVFEWTKGGKIKLPILGNDQYGDCYYAAPCHMSQVWTGSIGDEAVFDRAAVVARYLKVSGGDNGLGDEQVYPEWKNGIVGPNGPHKILDEMTVNPSDSGAIDLAMYRFGGLLFTFSLPGSWRDKAAPGATWDSGGSRSVGGHAVTLSGKNAKGGWDLNTWGIQPPVNLTHAGMMSVDPEVIVAFSLEWYDPKTGMSPAGFHYTDDALLWTAMGGKQLPPSPFAPPAPPVPPGPPMNPYMIRFQTDLKAGTYSWGDLSSDIPQGTYLILLGGDGPPPNVVP